MRCIAAFVSLPSAFVGFNIITLGWHIQNLIIFLISLKSNHIKHGGQWKAFEFWNTKISPVIDDLRLKFSMGQIKQRQTVYLVIASVFVIANVIGSALLATDTFSNGYSQFFASPISPSAITLFVTISINTINTLIWIFPLFYMILLTTLLTSTFGGFQ